MACAAYVLNRYGLVMGAPWALPNHFNDLLLIPCALPLVLWLHRALSVRAHDRAPTGIEIASHLLIWSVACEWIGPHLIKGAVGDPIDVLAYALGAVAAWCWWKCGEAATEVADTAPGWRRSCL